MRASAVWSAVTVDEAGTDVEAAARELVGRRADDVRYYAMPCGIPDGSAWDLDVAHVADYGVDLVVTPGGTTGITWTRYGQFGYGLQLVRGPVLTGTGPGRVLPRGRQAALGCRHRRAHHRSPRPLA